jgi:EmrB/QacA subfamily drug resistance transporter
VSSRAGAQGRASRGGLILFSLLLAAFVINVDSTIVNVALPTLVRKLHATNTQLQWVVDAYNLVFAALLLASGSLGDRVGRKGMLLCGLGVFGLASIAGAFTTTAGQLIVARCFMGLGAAMIFPATLSLISNIFTDRTERARAIGLWGATVGVSVALGPIAGGWLLAHFSWPSIFIAMAPLAIVGAALVAYTVPTSRDPHAPKSDHGGFVLSTAAMALLIFTIIEAPNHGWGSVRSLAGFGVAAVLLGLFVAFERRVRYPMLDISLFRNPRFTAASCSEAVSFFALFGFTFLITQFFQFFKGYTALSAGIHLLPVAISVGVASVIGTKLAVRFGTKIVVAAGLLMMAAFYAWVSTANATLAYGVIAVQMTLFGTGLGFTSAPATEAILGVVPKEKAGVGSAVNDATRLLGGALGVAVMGSIYASLYGSGLRKLLPRALPAPLARAVHNSAGAALKVSKVLRDGGHADLAAAVHHAVLTSFFGGFSAATLVAAGVAGAGSVMALLLLPAQPLHLLDHAAQQAGLHDSQTAPLVAE